MTRKNLSKVISSPALSSPTFKQGRKNSWAPPPGAGVLLESVLVEHCAVWSQGDPPIASLADHSRIWHPLTHTQLL